MSEGGGIGGGGDSDSFEDLLALVLESEGELDPSGAERRFNMSTMVTDLGELLCSGLASCRSFAI